MRWLAQNNKKDEAKDMLLYIAQQNKRKLSLEQINEIDIILDEVAADQAGKETRKLSPLHMFRKGYIFTTGILIVGWICTNLGYYRYHNGQMTPSQNLKCSSFSERLRYVYLTTFAPVGRLGSYFSVISSSSHINHIIVKCLSATC